MNYLQKLPVISVLHLRENTSKNQVIKDYTKKKEKKKHMTYLSFFIIAFDNLIFACVC